jgi:DHA1 family multidrug resistance protein-like MFS transporter
MTGLLPAEAWRRNQYVASVMVFVVFTGFAFVLPFLPLYVQELGVQDPRRVALWAGVLIGITPWLAGVLAPVWGRLVDRYGQKPIAASALVSYVVVLVLSALVTSVWQLFALRVALGLVGGIGPLGLAMATALAPREETGRAVGFVQSAQNLSAALGPAVGGLLAHLIGTRRTFLVTALTCAMALVLVLRYYQEAPPVAAPAKASPRSPFADVLAIPGVLGLLVVLFLVNFIGRSFTPILPQHLQNLGVPPERLALSTGALISVYAVAATLSALSLGRATRRHSPRPLLVASLVGGAVTVLPMALVTSFPPMLLLGVLLGLASGGALTLCYTMGGLLVPVPQRATAYGFFSGAALFGGALSPSVAGLLSYWSLRGVFYADAGLFLVLALALLLPGALARSVNTAQAQPETAA